MIRKAFDVSHPALHVALGSLELSALGIAAFDPDTLPAIRAGQRINTIDGDDSGTLVHAVPLVAWPDALWRALAGTFLGGGGDAQPADVDLPTLYAPRLIPDPADRSLLVALTPLELAAGMSATHPDAWDRKDRIAARIRNLEELAWSDAPIALLGSDALSTAGWEAAGRAMRDPDRRWRWSPALRRAARSTRDDEDAANRRAEMRLSELHTALYLRCEMSGVEVDVGGYHDDLVAAILADPIALRILRESEADAHDEDDLAIVSHALDERGHCWREVADSAAADVDEPPSLAA